MTPPLTPPSKEVDVDFLVFVERHATDLLRWDILTFFGQHPDFSGTTAQIAQQIGRSSQTIRPELGDLALTDILERKKNNTNHSVYSLTQTPKLRQLTIKLANRQLERPDS